MILRVEGESLRNKSTVDNPRNDIEIWEMHDGRKLKRKESVCLTASNEGGVCSCICKKPCVEYSKCYSDLRSEIRPHTYGSHH